MKLEADFDVRSRVAPVRMQVDGVRHDPLARLQKPTALGREEVCTAPHLVHRPGRVRSTSAALVGRPDDVMDDVASADRGAAAVLRARDVVHLAHLQGGDVAVFSEPDVDRLDLAPPVRRVPLYHDVLAADDESGLPIAQVFAIGERAGGGHIRRIALAGAGIGPIGDLGNLERRSATGRSCNAGCRCSSRCTRAASRPPWAQSRSVA